jgi:hypothetical protein
MSLTRANTEAELVQRQKSRMEAVSMAVTFVGSNADLNSPIGFAVRKMGGTVASFSSVADADLTFLAEDDFDKFLDIAEYRLMQNIKGRWGMVDTKIGPRSESLSQFSEDLERDLTRKLSDLQSIYGFGGGSLEAGVVDYDFAETDED